LQSSSLDILGGALDENTSSDLTAVLDFAEDAPLNVPVITDPATESPAPLADTSSINGDNNTDPLQTSSPDILGGPLDENTSSDLTGVLDFANDAPLDVPDFTDTATEGPAPVADTSSISDDSNADPLQMNSPDILGGPLDENTSSDLTGVLDFADGAPLEVPDITCAATESLAPLADKLSISDVNDSDLLQSGDRDEPTSRDLTAPLSIVDDAALEVPNITGSSTTRQVPLVDTSGIIDGNDSNALESPGLDFVGSTTGETKSNNDHASPLSIVDDGPLELPTISGNAIEGQVLCVDTSPISDADELGAFSFQWMRNNVVIDSATASIYSLNDTDVGACISVLVSYTDAQGTIKGPLTSMQTTEVVEIHDEPTGELRLAGSSPAN